MAWLKDKLQGSIFGRFVRNSIDTPTDNKSLSHLDLNAIYDRQTIEVMRRVLKRNSNGIDIGAHRGDILSQMLTMAPAGTHHAFEPLPDYAARLRRKFPKVRVHQMAVSDKSGEAEFQHVENDPAYSGLKRRIYDRPDPQIVAIKVPVGTIDEIIPSDLPIAFIKIDIEGGEFHALTGAVNTIRRYRPVIVFEAGKNSTGEYGVSPTALYELIETTLGYRLSTMGRWLENEPPLTLPQFCHNWDHGPDFYFIATPAGE